MVVKMKILKKFEDFLIGVAYRKKLIEKLKSFMKLKLEILLYLIWNDRDN